jgi:PEP-CTERM motif
MYRFKSSVIAAGLALCGAGAQAADFSFSGNIAFHNDIVSIDFTLLTDATDVKVWTDGFDSGVNFDPITAVWALPSGDNIGENDDDDTIAPGQTYYDSGLVFDILPAGNYRFTIATFPNFANGSNLSDGFAFDGETPIAIGDWCQPASDNCIDQKGTFWSVRLSGVDVAAVPEPETYALMGLGLAAVGWTARRKRQS